MSYGSLVLFAKEPDENGDYRVGEIEYRNGYGIGPIVWRLLTDKYAPGKHWMVWLQNFENRYQGETISDRYQKAVMAEVSSPSDQNILLFSVLEPTLLAREHWECLVSDILALFEVPSLDELRELVNSESW